MANQGNEQQLRFRWNDHMQHVSKVLTLQRLEEQFCDITLVSDDGYVMKAHQAILASTSAYFHRVLAEVTSDQHPMIVLRGANFREMSCLLDYMYQGNTQVDQSLMEAVLEVADMLEVKGLSKIRTNSSIKKFMGPSSSSAKSNTTNHTSSMETPVMNTKSPENVFYSEKQQDGRGQETECSWSRLSGNMCDTRHVRDNSHIPTETVPVTHIQSRASCREANIQDDEEVQTSGIDLSLAKNEPWSPKGSTASPRQKEDNDDEQISPSKKKRKQEDSLCSEETVDPVLDPDWGRIGAKADDSQHHKPPIISLTSITTTEVAGMDAHNVVKREVAQQQMSPAPSSKLDQESSLQTLRESHSFVLPMCPSTSATFSMQHRPSSHGQHDNNVTDLLLTDAFSVPNPSEAPSHKTCLEMSNSNEENAVEPSEKSLIDDENVSCPYCVEYILPNDCIGCDIDECKESIKSEISYRSVSASPDIDIANDESVSAAKGHKQCSEQLSNEPSPVVLRKSDFSTLPTEWVKVNVHFKRAEISSQSDKLDFTNSVTPSSTTFSRENVNRKANSVTQKAVPLCPLEEKLRRPINSIKRPVNKFMVFQLEKRAELKLKYPTEKPRSILQRLADMWKKLPSSEKAIYEAKAKALKEEHKSLHPNYKYTPAEAVRKRKEYKKAQVERRNLYRITPEFDVEPKL